MNDLFDDVVKTATFGASLGVAITLTFFWSLVVYLKYVA
jgi:hypothetical protein